MEKRSEAAESEIVQEERRQVPRVDTDATVAVELGSATIFGSGENISSQGLYFVSEARIPVTVRIVGRAEPVHGMLVRVQSMGDGRFGIAVKFSEPVPSLD